MPNVNINLGAAMPVMRRDAINAYAATVSGGQHSRADAAGMWLETELEEQNQRVYRKKYPQLKFAMGLVIPIRATVSRGKKTGSYKMYSHTGVAKWLTTGAWKDIPRASVSAERAYFQVREFGIGYGWELGELEEAQATGAPLQAEESFAARRGSEQFLNQVGARGDDDVGIHGFLNLPNMTVVDAAPNSGGVHRWSTLGVNAKDAVAMKQDIDLLIRTMRLATNNVEKITRIWLPPSFWERTTSVFIPGTSKTARQHLEESFPGIRFDELDELENAGTYDGPCIMASAVTGPEDIWLEVPISYEIHGPFQDGLSWNQIGRSSTGGVITPYPQALIRMDFPADS